MYLDSRFFKKITELTIPRKKLFLAFYFGSFSLSSLVLAYLMLTINPSKYGYMLDYTNFYTGATIASQGRLSHIYDPKVQFEVHQDIVDYPEIRAFRSLPFVAVALAPLGDIDFAQSRYVFLVISWIALLGTIVFVSRKRGKEKDANSYANSNFDYDPNSNSYSDSNSLYKLYLLPILITLAYYPFTISTYNGQITFFMAVSTTLAIYFQKRKKEFLAGLAIVGILIKPHFLLIAIFMLLLSSDKKRYISGLAIGSATLLSIGMKELGPYYLFDYVKFLFNTENSLFGTPFKNVNSLQSFFLVFARLGIVSANSLTKLTTICILILFPYFIYKFYIYIKKSKNLEKDYNLLITVALMITLALAIHSFIQDHLILIYALILLWEEKKKTLFWILHPMPYLVYTTMPYMVSLIYLYLSWYLLKYGYERFSNSTNNITKSWSKNFKTLRKLRT